MGGVVPKAPLPTSAGKIKSGARSSAGYAFGAFWLLLGLGFLMFLMPFISRVPFVGPMAGQGLSLFTNGKSSAMSTSRFGRAGGR